MDKKEKKSLPEPRTYTVEQIAAMLTIGRTTAYQLVKQEEFRIVRIDVYKRQVYEILYFICYMGYDLNGRTEILAAALFVEHVPVYFTGGEIRCV